MPKSARSSKSASTSTKKKKATSSRKNNSKRASAVSSQSSFRDRIESMYELHLMVLLFMTVIVSVLVVFFVKQQNAIDSLEFRLDFMKEQYHKQREYNGEILNKERATDDYGISVSAQEPSVE